MYKTKLNKIKNLVEKIKNDITLPLISDFLDWFLEKLEIHFNWLEKNLELSRWEIFFVNLWKNIWWELNKIRPCIIYSHKKYNYWNTIIIIPLKSYKWKINKNFHIFIKHWKNNLKKDSIADLGSLRQVSKKRLKWSIWIIENDILLKIDKKLTKILLQKK